MHIGGAGVGVGVRELIGAFVGCSGAVLRRQWDEGYDAQGGGVALPRDRSGAALKAVDEHAAEGRAVLGAALVDVRDGISRLWSADRLLR